MTCICDKLLKHFFPLVSLQKSRHITQQTRPKTTTWHFADPHSLPPDREKGEKKDDSSFRSDIKRRRESEKERGGEKKNGYISAVTACWKSLASAEQFLSPSLSLSPPSIYPSKPLSISVSLSHQNLPPIRISVSHALWMGCENTRSTQGVKRQD